MLSLNCCIDFFKIFLYNVTAREVKIMDEQILKAIEVRKNAYAPYSKYQVGACLKTKSGKLYAGCNIENNGIQSICAERLAFAKALSEGETEFESIVIVGGKEGQDKLDIAMPCGYCRQFMQEFVENDFKIIVYQTEKNKQIYTMEELLPHSFIL